MFSIMTPRLAPARRSPYKRPQRAANPTYAESLKAKSLATLKLELDVYSNNFKSSKQQRKIGNRIKLLKNEIAERANND